MHVNAACKMLITMIAAPVFAITAASAQGTNALGEYLATWADDAISVCVEPYYPKIKSPPLPIGLCEADDCATCWAPGIYPLLGKPATVPFVCSMTTRQALNRTTAPTPSLPASGDPMPDDLQLLIVTNENNAEFIVASTQAQEYASCVALGVKHHLRVAD